MKTSEWAKKEIELAKKRERGDKLETEWDYGCACYDSALKAFLSLWFGINTATRQSIIENLNTRTTSTKGGKSKLSSVERKKGKWEKIAINPDAYDIVGVKTWAIKMRCNQCDFTTFAIEGHFAQYNFCPRCGSQNDVVEDAMLHTYKEGEE